MTSELTHTKTLQMLPHDCGQSFFFSVFITTYNRSGLLVRALDSVAAQNFADFEVVVVDVGSSDDTATVMAEYKRRASFPLTYIRQPNQGRHIAHNTVLPHLRGFLTVFLDSDDMLAPNALEIFFRHWHAIPVEQRERFVGVEGLCATLDGNIAGDRYPADILDSDYLEIRNRYGVGGDKKFAYRTDLLRQYPFPVIQGESYLRYSLLMRRLAHEYRTRHVNEVVQLIEYQPSGMSADRLPVRINNPQGFRLFFLEEVNNNLMFHTLPMRLAKYANFVRYSLLSGIGLKLQLREVSSPTLWLLSVLPGAIKSINDKRRLR